jgi:hypothetical protein
MINLVNCSQLGNEFPSGMDLLYSMKAVKKFYSSAILIPVGL